MSKGKRFIFQFLTFLVLTIALYSLAVYMQWLTVETNHATIIVGVILAIFLLGILIISPGLNKSPENFVMRFLILTTVQMLSVLSVILALVYTKYPEAKTMGFHLIFIFCFLLATQSVLLIRINGKA